MKLLLPGLTRQSIDFHEQLFAKKTDHRVKPVMTKSRIAFRVFENLNLEVGRAKRSCGAARIGAPAGFELSQQLLEILKSFVVRLAVSPQEYPHQKEYTEKKIEPADGALRHPLYWADNASQVE